MTIIGQDPNALGIIGTGARSGRPTLGALSGVEGGNKTLLGSLFLDTPTGDQTVSPTGLAVGVAFGTANVGAQSVAPSGLAVGVSFGSPTVVASAVNNALRIDGEQDVLALGAVGALSGFTFFAWAKIVTDRNDYSGIFSMERRDGTDHSIEWNELITDVDGVTLKVFDHVTGPVGTLGVMTVGTWYRVAFRVTTTGTWAAFFGAEGAGAMSKVTGSLTNVTSGNNYAGLGSTNFAATEWLNGALAHVRKWDAELSDAEIERESHSDTPVRTANLLVAGLYRDVTTGTVLTTPVGADFIDGVGGGTPDYTITAGPVAVLQADPAGLAVPVSFGSATVAQAGQTISPSGLAVAVAFGTAGVQPGAVTVSPTGLAVGVSFGSASISNVSTVSPTGLAVAVAFGTADVQRGTVTVSPSGLATAVAFGSATVQRGTVTVSPSGLAVAVAFGSATLNATNTLSPSGLAVGVAFGSASLNATNTLSPTGLAVGVAIGTATAQRGTVTVSPSGLAVPVSFGSSVVSQAGVQNVAPTGLAVGVAFGSAGVITNVTVSPTGYAAAVAFGSPAVTSVSTVAPSGLAVGVALGSAQVQPGPVSISAVGLNAAVQWGTPEVVRIDNQTVSPVGYAVSVVFGDALAYNDPAIRKPSTMGVKVVQVKPWPPPRGAWWFNGDR